MQGAPENNVFYRSQKWHYPRIARGEGIYLYGEDGRQYLDACSGSAVANLGHGNKEVAEFAREQMETIAFTHLSRFSTRAIEQCAAKVADWTPDGLDHVYFVSGGSEATETAIKMARQFYVERDGASSQKWKVISKWNSFHGNTIGALSMTGMMGRRGIYDPMLLAFPKVPQFYHYRNPWGEDLLYGTSVRAAEALEEEILKQGADTVAAFITEPVVGAACPGIHPHQVYFQKVRDICDRYDILLIVDEVMSGFGRTGEKMAVEHFGAMPDLITLAKGMSCGYTPIGACVANRRVYETIMLRGSGEFVHGHTYAGNPLSTGIAAKVLDIMERDNIVENSNWQGAHLQSRLAELYQYPIVGDIRGLGLMIGMEFVKDKDSKEPFARSVGLNSLLTACCLDAGIVVYPGGGTVDGVRGDHILIAPPLNITATEVEELVARLQQGIRLTCEKVL